MNEQLQAMRWLMGRERLPADDDSLTPVQKKCRELFESDFTEFMRQKTLLEKAELLRRKEALKLKQLRKQKKKPEKDEGTDKAIAVLEKWLQDYEREYHVVTDQGQTPS